MAEMITSAIMSITVTTNTIANGFGPGSALTETEKENNGEENLQLNTLSDLTRQLLGLLHQSTSNSEAKKLNLYSET